MQRTLAHEFGVEYPIFAFSHCRDVVAEVSRRGGFGVFGAASVDAEQLEIELRWIDEHCGGKPYGVDVLWPARTADTGTRDRTKLGEELAAKIPTIHRQFVRDVLTANGIATRPIDAPFKIKRRISGTSAGTRPMVEIALAHPLVRLFVSALGTPPPDVIGEFHEAGVKVGALAGSRHHAERHVQGGVDLIVAQGTEAGGHTGEISTMVLVPEVVDAVAPIPVLAAGGIGSGRQIAAALALGAKGVWMGSVWLTVAEAATTERQRNEMIRATSSDTVRSKCLSGKPIRQLRSEWTDAWSSPGAPLPLELPLQLMLLEDAIADDSPAGVEFPLSRPVVGQIVGRMNSIRSVRAVMDELVEELLTTLGGLSALLEDDSETV